MHIIGIVGTDVETCKPPHAIGIYAVEPTDWIRKGISSITDDREIRGNTQHYKWDFSSWVFRESCVSTPYCKLDFLRVKELPFSRNFLI